MGQDAACQARMHPFAPHCLRMKFLIDECLHPSLIQVAHERGHEAYHVIYLGLQGMRDEFLMHRIREQEFTFVTNNALDFERLFSKEPLHAGLVIFLKNLPPSLQREMFFALLLEIAGNEPVNSMVLVDMQEGNIVIETYPLFRRN